MKTESFHTLEPPVGGLCTGPADPHRGLGSRGGKEKASQQPWSPWGRREVALNGAGLDVVRQPLALLHHDPWLPLPAPSAGCATAQQTHQGMDLTENLPFLPLKLFSSQPLSWF